MSDVSDIVLQKLKVYLENKMNEEAPTNVMGASSSTGSPIATFDPVLKFKLGRRKLQPTIAQNATIKKPLG